MKHLKNHICRDEKIEDILFAVTTGIKSERSISLTFCCTTNAGLCMDYENGRENAQVVTNLQQICSNAVPTTCQKDVFALLVPSLKSCQQLVGNLLQGC
jgi:hypothetical protein